MPSTFLVTGANRGLGLEMARQLSARGDSVIATARQPERASELQRVESNAPPGRLRIEPLDVASKDSVQQLRARLEGVPIDTLVNNAGVGGDRKGLFEQDFDNHRLCFEVNSLGPFRLTLALIEQLRAGAGKQIVNVTSQLGSLTLNVSGGYHPYRASKAALNMFSRTLAAELGPEGFVCVMIHPGWVRTDMGGPNATLSVEESVGGMLEVVAGLEAGDNGRFLNWAGEEMPW